MTAMHYTFCKIFGFDDVQQCLTLDFAAKNFFPDMIFHQNHLHFFDIFLFLFLFFMRIPDLHYSKSSLSLNLQHVKQKHGTNARINPKRS